jgi:hypothetical protein
MATTEHPQPLNLRAGEWVVVRSKEEILRTLDARGQLENMPFMPEMFQYCGRRLRVHKRAHKTCDPVHGVEARRLPSTVHLEGLRCDGLAHGGCQAGCLIFWKEAWLQRADAPAPASGPAGAPATGAKPAGCSEQDVATGTVAPGQAADAQDLTYVCQATQVVHATTPIRWWAPGPYLEDLRSGNATLRRMTCAFLFFLYHTLVESRLGMGSALRWAYDAFQELRGGSPYPWRTGRVPLGERTPSARLDLQEGELARVKNYQEILETLDERSKNRGLYFDAEMVPYTRGTFRVQKRVQRIIDEKSGKMLHFKTDALILENVVCQARYSECRKLCPRAYYPYWREIWLERVAPAAGSEEA